MKRVLTIILAAALLLGMIPAAGAAFTDADKIAENHREAVEYVSGKGVISGFPDGSFKPKDTLTRAQAAKILCVALEGAEKANALTKADTGFTDVPASHWAAKYIAYCVDKGIVAGVGGGRFDPEGKLSGAAFAKMLLVAYEKADAKELTGEKWGNNTRRILKALGFDRGAEPATDEPTTRENACRLAYSFLLEDEIMQTEPDAYKETKIDFTDGGKYRLLSRALQTENGVICDWPATGVEFTADCKGKIELHVHTTTLQSTNQKFRVIVDGEASDQLWITEKGDNTMLAWVNVRPGAHTIRIVKDTGISPGTDTLKDVSLLCRPETVKPTEPKKKLLQVVGDSIAAGVGTIPNEDMKTTKNSSSVILSFGYLTAKDLDMDCEMVVRSGTGFLRPYGTPAYNYAGMYEYQNRWRDENAKYDFARKPDVVLLKVSNNDNFYTVEEAEPAIRDFIATVRKHCGADVPIVLVHYKTSKNLPIVEKLVAEDPKIYGVKMTVNRDGAGNHATAAAQREYADLIMQTVKPLIQSE